MSDVRARPVRASDKVSDVLARDDRLVDVFASQSPHFAKLRSPGMRRVMARLVTVEQAARICGAEPDALVRELNRALGLRGGESEGASAQGIVAQADAQSASHAPTLPHDQNECTPASRVGAPVPPVSKPWNPSARITELDVREDLLRGREPFSRIMAAVGALGDDEVFALRTTFEPVPLFTVMQKRGYDHLAERLAADDWRLWFYRTTAERTDGEDGICDTPPTAPHVPATSSSASEIVLDVRGMEPPEPMQHTLEALTTLPDGVVLIQVNVRVPHFLLPILEERGFGYEIHEPSPERVVVRIWRAAPDASTRAPAGG